MLSNATGEVSSIRGSSGRTSTESVKEMLEESKEINDGDEKETRKRRGRRAGKKVAKKRKMVLNREGCTKYMQARRDGEVKKPQWTKEEEDETDMKARSSKSSNQMMEEYNTDANSRGIKR